MPDLVIETYELTKVFQGIGQRIVAVNEVSIKVPNGVVFGLLGPNGAGKSTLLSMLIGLTLPTKGGGKVLGYDIVKESLEIRKRVGILPERIGFYEHLTPVRNLTLIGKLNGLSGKELEDRIKHVLRMVGLSEHMHKNVGAFSRGMRQRLGLACALLKDPDLLLLDEPTAGIDPEGVKVFRGLVRDLSREGRTIVISTHLLRELGPLCTHIAIMKEGRILVQGAVKEIFEDFLLKRGFTYDISLSEVADQGIVEEIKELGNVVDVQLKGRDLIVRSKVDLGDELYDMLTKRGYRLRKFTMRKPTLEDVFLYYSRGEGANEVG